MGGPLVPLSRSPSVKPRNVKGLQIFTRPMTGWNPRIYKRQTNKHILAPGLVLLNWKLGRVSPKAASQAFQGQLQEGVSEIEETSDSMN